MVVAILFFLSLAFAKNNYRVSPDTSSAALACHTAGLCDYINGCCSGHGYCNATSTPVCVCDVPVGCDSSYTNAYTGATCNTSVIGDPSGSPAGCCVSNTYEVKRDISGACNQRSGVDPEQGATGRLLRRVTGTARYDDDMSTFSEWASPWDSVESIADYLTDSERPVTYRNYTMLGLALLEAGAFDVVRYALRDDAFHNISGDDTYAKLKPQARTGEEWGSTPVAQQFENVATGEVDLDFVYAEAARIAETTYGTTGPYIDYSSTLSLYNDQHVSEELLVMVEFFGYNHNFLVKAFELYLFNQTSDVTPFDHTLSCTVPTFLSNFPTNQEMYDKLFNYARNANIRLLQLALGNSALSLIAPHEQPSFEHYFHPEISRNWSCEGWIQDFRSGTVTPGDPISVGSEFATRTSLVEPLTHLASTGIDWLLSMKVPLNLSRTILPSPACGFTVPTIAEKLFVLANTQTKTFGSRIDPYYYDDLVLQLLRIRELGLESYNDLLAATSGSSQVPRTVDTDVYLGLHLDTDSGDGDYDVDRLFQSDPAAVPELLLALYGGINDVLNIDTFGSWFLDNTGNPINWWLEILADDGLAVYACEPPWGPFCYDIRRWATWQLLTAGRADYTIRDDLFRSRGLVNPYPCTFPGTIGNQINAAIVHYALIAPTTFDFETDLSLPTYHGLNDLPDGIRFDETYRGGPNGISACIPWRTSLWDSNVDNTCCQGAAVGACTCDVNPYASGICGYTGLCESYDNFAAGDMNAIFETYNEILYPEPVSAAGIVL